MVKSQNRGAGQKKFEAWINDPGKVMAWVCKHKLEELLDDGGGLAKITNFFPDFVAEGILHVLQSAPAKHWNVTEAARDHTKNNIAHKFWCVGRVRCSERSLLCGSCSCPRAEASSGHALRPQVLEDCACPGSHRTGNFSSAARPSAHIFRRQVSRVLVCCRVASRPAATEPSASHITRPRREI